jgi:MoxR-like ATPase
MKDYSIREPENPGLNGLFEPFSYVEQKPDIDELNRCAKQYVNDLGPVFGEIGKVVVGQEKVINQLVIALIAGGHVLLEGVPGIAKTLTIRTLSRILDCSFTRIQFTPDLLPADIIGTKIYNSNQSGFNTFRGPIFHQFILADEINRAPPKVQSALLEAMQELQVTIQGETIPLTKPFFVMATQNPLESEGTYPLPDAQVDRFMFKILMGYPSCQEEMDILDRYTGNEVVEPGPVLSIDKINGIQAFARKIHVERSILQYVVRLTDATRHPISYDIDLAECIDWGASPRASLWLVLGAKSHALLNGRGYVIPEDVTAVAHAVLRHRILISYEGLSEGINPDDVIDMVLAKVEIP